MCSLYQGDSLTQAQGPAINLHQSLSRTCILSIYTLSALIDS